MMGNLRDGVLRVQGPDEDIQREWLYTYYGDVVVCMSIKTMQFRLLSA
jgi:hypothetical protein